MRQNRVSVLSKPTVIPTFRFYKELVNDYSFAETSGLRKIWWLSFIFGGIGDILFFLCSSYLIWLALL